MSEALTNWPAQLLGAAGYFLIFLSPLTRTRGGFVGLDVAGLIPVGVHYVMLGYPAGAAMCVVYVLKDLVALGLGRRLWDRAYWGFYPLTVVLGLATWADARDGLALLGSLLAVVSRHQEDLAALKAFLVLSTVFWAAYGLAVGSAPQVVFSVCYAATGVFAYFRDRKAAPRRRDG